MTHSIIKELISNSVIDEALISKQDLPKVDPSQGQNVVQSVDTNADGSTNTNASPEQKKEADDDSRASERRSFQRHSECLNSCMSLAEYHCESLMECNQLKEMESAVTERIKLAAQMLKTAKEYISEIQGGYVAPPSEAMPQPSAGSKDAQSS